MCVGLKGASLFLSCGEEDDAGEVSLCLVFGGFELRCRVSAILGKGMELVSSCVEVDFIVLG